MTDSMLNLTQMSNIDVPGQFVFRVDERLQMLVNTKIYISYSNHSKSKVQIFLKSAIVLQIANYKQ